MMRFFLAGILHLTFALTVLAQANGDIESIGFDHAYRPGTWTPMVVRLTPTSGSPFKGKIAVYQEDGDHDVAIFTRPIALRGNSEGGGDRTQRFWMYFIPQPELLRDGDDLTSINRKLRVYLTNEDSPPKQLSRLLVKDRITEVDEGSRSRSTKLVLCVTSLSRPIFSPYAELRSPSGLKENVLPVLIPIGSVRSLLPESALGYEAVDAILWCDADPSQLSNEQRTAMEEYIRRGGKLIVSQSAKPNTWEMIRRGFGPLLPVNIRSIAQSADVTALKRIVKSRAIYAPADRESRILWKDIASGPYDIADAKPKPGAVVVETEEDEGAGRPWLVRGMFGAGSVTWVAQDLGDSTLTGRASSNLSVANEDFKWLYIWDRVFDWGNSSQPQSGVNPIPRETDGNRKRYQERYAEGAAGTFQMSRTFLAGMEFPKKGAQYLGIAVLFFVLYWIFAGPGSYLYLAGRKRADQSWFIFAAAALVATVITVLLVNVLLRGPADVRHVSFVRMTPGESAVVESQFGLYVPRNSWQHVELKNTDRDAVSYVTAYPTLTSSDEGAPPIDYEVPVFGAKAVDFYYRSTLKKLHAKWVGDLPMGVEGSATIASDLLSLDGKLLNKTGRALKNVYVMYRPRFLETSAITNETELRDQILYIPAWSADGTLDLKAEYATKRSVAAALGPLGNYSSKGSLGLPNRVVRGQWDFHWYNTFNNDPSYDDRQGSAGNFAMLSIFDHLPTPGVELDVHRERWEIHRAALRDQDISGALGAGQLIVLAQSENDRSPLPLPVTVEGDVLSGEGVIYYQFILPLNRSAVSSTTKPATQPAPPAAAEKLSRLP